LKARGLASWGTEEIRDFLTYLKAPHANNGDRWGNHRLTKPARPQPRQTYHSYLRSLFNCLVREGRLAASSMRRLKAPRVLADQVRPFIEIEVEAVFGAAATSHRPLRARSRCLTKEPDRKWVVASYKNLE
jgi:hypothetical protein